MLHFFSVGQVTLKTVKGDVLGKFFLCKLYSPAPEVETNYVTCRKGININLDARKANDRDF